MAPTEDDAVGISRTVVALAQFQLDQMRGASDNANNKALGVLGSSAAVGATAVAVGITGTSLGRHWWAVLVGLAISAGISIYVVALRDPEIGTDPEDFWASYGGLSELDATVQLIADVGAALKLTRDRVVSKGRWFSASLIVLAITSVYSAVVFTLVR